MKQLTDKYVLSALFAALLSAIVIPYSKILSSSVSPAMLGGLLYLGAGIGLFIIFSFKKQNNNLKLSKKEIPYIIAMVLTDISAIIFLMLGISKATGANASLLTNFELVVTSLAARFIFKEFITKKTWIAVCLISFACILLSFEGYESFIFNTGSLFVLLSAVLWGFENNITRLLSAKDTVQITTIKGLCSGTGSLIIGFMAGENIPEINFIFTVLTLGFVSYGLSVCLYIYSQRYLGAVKTASYFSTSPFFGSIFCLIFLGEKPLFQFYIAALIMILGTILIVRNTKNS